LCWASASTGRGSTLQCRISRPEIEECLKYSLPLVPTVFLSWSNSQVDRLILLSLLRLGVLGVYGAAAKVAMIITVLVQVFRLAWLPIALSHIDQSSRNSYFRSSLIAYLAVMTCIGLVLVTYSREPLTLLTTSEYASGYVVIPWLVGAQIFYGSASITNIGMLIHADQ
jgi:O-antigen/teichoic acid export membrane protein